jgi:lipopolysaccharide export LptBFGC system permease protein LptF
MAEPEGAEFQRKVTLAFYAFLLAGGIALYWIWGLLYDTWYPFNKGNIAIYVVYAPMIAFGIIGLLLYRKKQPMAQ